MAVQTRRRVEVYRINPIIIWITVFAALLLQLVLPLKIPQARRLDFPLLVTIYFALLRRSPIFGIGLGTAVGLTQDALAHGLIGTSGIAKALIGYLAASSATMFDLEQFVPRFLFSGTLILVHRFVLFGIERALLVPPPAFVPKTMLIDVLLNVILGLFIFYLLDRFKQSA